MTTQPIDTDEMLVIHDTLRKHFSSLPLMVKGAAPGHHARAEIVGAHVLLLLDMLHAHHDGEDLLVWPKLTERCPDALALLGTMEDQHGAIDAGVQSARAQASAWMADPTVHARAELHTTLISIEKALLAHLALEEVEVLPLIAKSMTDAEFAELGEHARAGLTQQQMTIVLGLILDAVSAERAEAILSGMPAEARAGFETFGIPAYNAYRERLVSSA